MLFSSFEFLVLFLPLALVGFEEQETLPSRGRFGYARGLRSDGRITGFGSLPPSR
jgi:hypothetical protein